MNPVGQAPSSGRPRAQSLLGSQYPQASVAGSSLTEEPKILEDDGLVVSPAASKHDHDHDHDSDSYSDEDLRDDEETGLTRTEKERKQKKKRRNTLLDQRIAREKGMAPDERKGVNQSIGRRIAINLGLIFLWYFFSLSISLVSRAIGLLNHAYTR